MSTFLFPYDSFVAEATGPVTTLVERFSPLFAEPTWVGLPQSSRNFEGAVTSTGFKAMTTTRYRNSFAPVVRGWFESKDDDKVVVTVTMRPPLPFLAFLCGWVLSWGAMLASALLEMDQHPDWIQLLAPIGMILFAWVLATSLFWYEANRARAAILQALASDALTGTSR